MALMCSGEVPQHRRRLLRRGLALGPLLLGAVLAPTDPVLASDVQVEGPTPADEGAHDEGHAMAFADEHAEIDHEIVETVESR